MLSGKASAGRFGEVVLPHLGDALSLARWLTGNATDAEDVVQEACLKAHAGLGAYAGGNARAWLLTIVRNTSYSWLARNRPRNVVMAGDMADIDELVGSGNDPELAGGPEAALIAKSDRAALEAAIAALPHPFREVIVLRDVNDLAYREIAAVLDLPLGTVMSRLARARATLISKLGGKP